MTVNFWIFELKVSQGGSRARLRLLDSYPEIRSISTPRGFVPELQSCYFGVRGNELACGPEVPVPQPEN